MKHCIKQSNILLFMVILLMVFPVCGLGETSGVEPKKPETLVQFCVADQLAVAEHNAAVFKEETGITVQLIPVEYNNMHNKVVSTMAAGGNVDIIHVDGIWTAEFAYAGWLEPLDDLIQESGLDINGVIPITYGQRVVDGKVYAWPGMHNAKFLVYRKDILAAGGYSVPPATWQELVEMSRDLKSKGLCDYGMVNGWTQAEGLVCDYTFFANSFGGKVYDAEKGEWVFNDEAGVKALEFMVDTIYKDGINDPSSVTTDDRSVVNVFISGNYPFLITWGFGVGSTKNMDVGIALAPGNSETGVASSSVAGGSALGINPKAPDNHKYWAWQYIKSYTQESNQAYACKTIGHLPIWTKLYDDPELNEIYPLKDMIKQNDFITARANSPYYPEASRILQAALQEALTQAKSPKEALDDAKAAMDASMVY